MHARVANTFFIPKSTKTCGNIFLKDYTQISLFDFIKSVRIVSTNSPVLQKIIMETYVMEIFKGGVDGLKDDMVVGMGNPLLDISANVDESFVKKYGLNVNDAIMAEEKHMPMYKELTEKYNPDYFAGGSVQNSMRVMQWILKKPGVAAYMGAVGNDKFAEILKNKAEEEGVHGLYQTKTDYPTGTCAVLLTSGGMNRSLCANLGAAQSFTNDFIDEPGPQKAITGCKLVYTSGFFITSSYDTILRLAKHANKHNLPFVFNASAPFVMEHYKPQLEELLPYIDILFGNDEEAAAIGKAFNLKGSEIEEIAVQVAALPKMNKSRSRLVVVTRGSESIVLIKEGKLEHVPVREVRNEQVVDTNGAGDAFAGGFLSQLVIGKPLKVCIDCGIYAAQHVIKRTGCSFGHPSDFKPDLSP